MPNKVTIQVKELCRGLVEDAAYQRKFQRDWRARRLPPRIEELVWHYAYGKPAAAVDLNVAGGRLTLEQVLEDSHKDNG